MIRYIRVVKESSNIDGSWWTHFGELEAYDGNDINVALNKTTTTNSTSSYGDKENANNGNTSGLYSQSDIWHSGNNPNPWWQVDLGASINITKVVLHNRKDANNHNTQLPGHYQRLLDGIKIKLMSLDNTTIETFTFNYDFNDATNPLNFVQEFTVTPPLTLNEFIITPTDITVENQGIINMTFSDNQITPTDISNSLTVDPSNAGIIDTISNTSGTNWTANFTPNYGLDLTDCRLKFKQDEHGIDTSSNTFNIETHIQQIKSAVLTLENIITDLSSNLEVVLRVPTGTIEPTITIDPSYIAYLDGNITSSDGGLTWNGTIYRTENMNLLGNTLTVSIDDISSNIIFDVVENSELINKKWSLTNSDIVNKEFTNTLQMSPNGLLMGFIDGSNVEIYRKVDTSYTWNHDVSYNGHSFALTNNRFVIASDVSLQIYDYSGSSWNIMNGGDKEYSNVVALSINEDGTYVAVSDNSDVRVYKFVDSNWIHYSTFDNNNVRGLSLSPNGLKLGMGIGNVGENFSSIVVKDVVDNLPPTIDLIELNGSININHEIGTAWKEPGYTATDNNDGDISNNVVITGVVKTDVSGVYTLYYDVSDNAGNVAIRKTRLVTVLNEYVVRWSGDDDIFEMLRFYDKLNTLSESNTMTVNVDDVDVFINGDYTLECNGFWNNFHYKNCFNTVDHQYVGIFNYTGSTRDPYDNSGNYQGYIKNSTNFYHSQSSTDDNIYAGEYMLLKFPLYFEIKSFNITCKNNGNLDLIPEDFVLLGSNDLSTYDTIFSYDGTPNTTDNITIDLLSNTSKYRNFKLIFTKGQSQSPHIEHLKWYGNFYTKENI